MLTKKIWHYQVRTEPQGRGKWLHHDVQVLQCIFGTGTLNPADPNCRSHAAVQDNDERLFHYFRLHFVSGLAPSQGLCTPFRHDRAHRQGSGARRAAHVLVVGLRKKELFGSRIVEQWDQGRFGP